MSRFFDPSLGRFTPPDTIVPTSTQGTQAWDRYAFVNNNPVRYNDPTGHTSSDTGSNPNGGCGGDGQPSCAGETTCKDSNATNFGADGFCSYPEPPDDIFHPFGLDSDYYSLSIYHGFPGWLIGLALAGAGLAEPTPVGEISGLTIAALLNAGATFTIDRYGRLYVSPGLSVGVNSIEVLPTVTVTAGNLMTGKYEGLPLMEGGSPQEIDSLLSGLSVSHSVSHPFFPTIGTTWSPAATHNAIDFGFGFPGNINIAQVSFGFGPFQVIK